MEIAYALEDLFRTFASRLNAMKGMGHFGERNRLAPPSPEVIAAADDFLQLLRLSCFLPKQIDPSVVGGVGFTFRQSGRKVYVEFNNKGKTLALYSDGQAMPVVQPVERSRTGYLMLITKAKAYLDEQNPARDAEEQTANDDRVKVFRHTRPHARNHSPENRI